MQEKRIKWWTSPEQDNSPHASSFAVREKVEAVFASDLDFEGDRESLLLEVEALRDGVAYLNELLTALS